MHCLSTCRWYSLKSKPGKKDEKYRGEIEVKVTFIVQSKSDGAAGSQSQLRIHDRAGSIKNIASAVSEWRALVGAEETGPGVGPGGGRGEGGKRFSGLMVGMGCLVVV